MCARVSTQALLRSFFLLSDIRIVFFSDHRQGVLGVCQKPRVRLSGIALAACALGAGSKRAKLYAGEAG